MCAKQGSQSDGWARKSPWHTQDQSTFKKGRGHAASVAPSHSLGDTQPVVHSQACECDASHSGAGWCGSRAEAVGSCTALAHSRMEARLHLSATVLKSTTLAGQPGHNPQPPTARALGSTGRQLGGGQGRGLHSVRGVREELPWAGRS